MREPEETTTSTRHGVRPVLALLMPRLQDVVFVALFLVVIALGPRLLNVDGDLGRHLTLGSYILDTRSVPTHDLFSHTMPGRPLTPHEWLAEVIFAAMVRAMGLNGVVLLCAVVIASTFALLYGQAVRRSNLSLTSLALVLLAAAASSLHWLARPHLFTMLLVVVWIGELERLERGGKGGWWRLPLLMLLWANVHGAFIAGFAIWLAYAADYLWRRLRPSDDRPLPDGLGRQLGAALLLSLAVTFINPSGYALWSTTFGFLGNRYLLSHTAEYLPPGFRDISTWPFLLLIGLSVAALAFGRRTLTLRSALLLIGWGSLGLYSVRNVPIFAVVAAPILAEGAASLAKAAPGWRTRESRFAGLEQSLRGHLWPALAVIGVALLLARGVKLDITRQGNRFDPAVFPVRAVDWLEANPPQGEVFNYFPWGGYLLYRAWPEWKVFIDGQTDFYGEPLTRQYEQVITLAPGWRDVLASYQVGWVLMPKESDLVRALRVEMGWVVAYEDEVAAVVERRPPGSP